MAAADELPINLLQPVGSSGQLLGMSTPGSDSVFLTGGYISCPTVGSAPTSLSLAIWFKINGAPTSNLYNFLAGQSNILGGGGGAGYALGLDASNNLYAVALATGNQVEVASGLTVGVWYLAILVWDGTTLTGYVNTLGGSVASASHAASGTMGNWGFAMGACETNNIQFFNGSLAEGVLGAGSAWTSVEIAALQAATTQGAWNTAVTAVSPTQWYHLNETTGSSAADSSGGSHTGTYEATYTLGQAGPLPASAPAVEWINPLNPVVGVVNTYSVAGLLAVAAGATNYLPPFFYHVATGTTAKLIGVRAVVRGGTSVTLAVKQNGSAVSSLSALVVTTTASFTACGTPPSVSDGDEFSIVVASISGTPDGLSFTFEFEVTL